MATRSVRLKIHDESDLYSPMDPEQNTLSDDTISYLSRFFINKHRQQHEDYVIDIVSDTPLNEEHVKETIRAEFSQQADNVRYTLKRMTYKEVCLGFVGLVALTLWLYLSGGTDNVNLQLLSVVALVSLWGVAELAFMKRPDLWRLKRSLERLANTEIRFSPAEAGKKDGQEKETKPEMTVRL
jgi:hypothetical protein